MKEEVERILDKKSELKEEKNREKQLKIKKLIIQNARLEGNKNGASK